MARYPTPCKATRRCGFTLVEILIVVIILGILAAIVIPQFSNAAGDARMSSVLEQRKMLRTTVEFYRMQHALQLPDLITDQWRPFVEKTDVTGAFSPPAGTEAYGPYLMDAPVNALNRQSAIAAAPGAAVGWVYDATTGQVDAVDAAGTGILP
ncbi:MAG TPA: prepilin-type N-terminal cleavage/methylation domain-containing protein [Tepidisphaeraceae bacterium]|nr:prepilin-type N-terminal cleavage/methylation domain-containing protein [Tepidisphaeraceae bacterium]